MSWGMNKKSESSVQPQLCSGAGDANHGMVINCAAYEGGCRVGDIDLDQAHKVATSDGRFGAAMISRRSKAQDPEQRRGQARLGGRPHQIALRASAGRR